MGYGHRLGEEDLAWRGSSAPGAKGGVGQWLRGPVTGQGHRVKSKGRWQWGAWIPGDPPCSAP